MTPRRLPIIKILTLGWGNLPESAVSVVFSVIDFHGTFTDDQ